MNPTGTLTIYRHETLPPLAEQLAETLEHTQTVNPLTPVRIAVPSFAVADWLIDTLATRNNGPYAHVANLHRQFVATTIDEILAGVLHDTVTDQFAPERLTWTILHLLRETAHADVYATIRPQLESPSRSGVAFAAHTADLFDRYIRYRPALLERWHAGDDTDRDGKPLAPHVRWQPALWRAIEQHVDEAPPHTRRAAAIRQLHQPNAALSLEAQYLLFGMYGLARSDLDVLTAVAQHRAVHLFFLTATRAFPLTTEPAPRHPFTATFTRYAQAQHRELSAATAAATVIDLAEAPHKPTALGLLQQHLAADFPAPASAERTAIDAHDAHLTVHACHGIVREIDAVKDQLLALLDADDTLTPNDIAIVTPNLAQTAPVIAGVLSDGDKPGEHDRNMPRLPFAVRDRSVATASPLADTIVDLLALAQSRVTLTEVTDLLTRPIVTEQLGLTDTEIASVVTLLRDAGVRWGIDGTHRAQLGSAAGAYGSFTFGFDRLTLGIACENAGDTVLFDVAPHSTLTTEAGQQFLTVMRFLTDVFDAIRQWQTPQPVRDWVQTTDWVIDTLLAAPAHDVDRQQDADTIARIASELAAATGTHLDIDITLTEYTELFTRACARHGVARVNDTGITVSSLAGIRSIPFRVICIVGLNDTSSAGQHDVEHDLIAAQPELNDTNAADELRQNFADAVQNATDQLIVSHSGHDPRTGDATPRARILDDLYDTLDTYFTAPDGSPFTELITIRHPRHLTDLAYYTHGSPLLRTDRTFSAAARATANGPPQPRQDRFRSFAPKRSDTVDIAELMHTLKDPSRAYLRRHGIAVVRADDVADDRDRFTFTGLARHQVYDDLMHWENSHTRTAYLDAIPHQGRLPVGSFGTQAHTEMRTFAAELAAVRNDIADRRRTHTITLPIGAHTLTGDVTTFDSDVVLFDASSNPQQTELAAWITVLALHLTYDTPHQATVYYRDNNTLKSRLVASPTDPDVAHATLTEMIAVAHSCLAQPVPFFPRTSYTYAQELHKGAAPDQALRKADSSWDGFGGYGDGRKDPVRYLYGNDISLRQVAHDPRFHACASAIFSPLFVAREAATA